jgi:perosamine synthetase
VDRRSVVDALAADGIPTRVYFPPLHLQPYVREMLGTHEGMLPVTEDIAERTLALPFHNNLLESQVEHVVDALRRAVTKP